MALTPSQRSKLMKDFLRKSKPSTTTQQKKPPVYTTLPPWMRDTPPEERRSYLPPAPAPPKTVPRDTVGPLAPGYEYDPLPELTPEQEQVQETIQELKDTPLSITYRDPYGEVKTYQRVGFDPYATPGEVISVRKLDPAGKKLRPVLLSDLDPSSPTIRERQREQYQKTGKVPELYGSQITIPESIKFLGLGPEYVRYGYTRAIGLKGTITPERVPGYKLSGRPSSDPFRLLVESSFLSLSPARKFEFGVLFGDVKKTPVGEWKYFEGGTEYISGLPSTERIKLIEKYIDEQPKDHDLWSKIKTGFDVGMTHSPILGVPMFVGSLFGLKESERSLTQTKRQKAWKELQYSPMEIGQQQYDRLNIFQQNIYSTQHALVSASLWPVTLTQVGVKYATGKGDVTDILGRIQTGKTLVLPDIGKTLQDIKMGGPSGLIGVGISEGIGAVTGEGSQEWEKVQKYPIQTFFATSGEILGLYAGSKGLHLAKVGIGKGYQYFKSEVSQFGVNIPSYPVKYTPKNLYGRFTKRLIHKKVPAEEYFAPKVVSGEKMMDFTRGGPDAMIKKFESIRDPTTGRIPVVHATASSLKTTLRSRPSGLIFDKQGRLLLMQHDKLPTYLTVGGGKGKFELASRSLLREAREELGIKLIGSKKLFSFPDYPSGNIYNMFKAGFKGTPRKLGETSGFRFFKLGGKQFDDVLKAWHVKEAVSKYRIGDFTSIKPIGQSMFRSYPPKFVIGVGKRTTSVTGGMHVTPKGFLGDWAFSLKRLLPESAKVKFTLFKRSKPAIVSSEIDAIVRMPSYARRSYITGDSFLKYSHKATLGDKFKAYITPKTEAYPGLYHSAETEAIIPSGYGMRKLPLGIKPTSIGAVDKWYNMWAKVTGYKEYTIVPRYGVPVPIRTYELFKLPSSPGGLSKTFQKSISASKFTKIIQKSSSGMSDIYSGISYKPIISGSMFSRAIAMSISSALYSYPSKPSYPTRSIPSYPSMRRSYGYGGRSISSIFRELSQPSYPSYISDSILSYPSRPSVPSYPSRPSVPSYPSGPSIPSIPSYPSMPKYSFGPSVPVSIVYKESRKRKKIKTIDELWKQKYKYREFKMPDLSEIGFNIFNKKKRKKKR